MKHQINQFRAGLAACLLTSIALAHVVRAAELGPEDKQFLTHYEEVRTALAADDLATAKTAAAPMGEAGAALAKSESIAEARKEFATMSERALQLAAGHAGYYHANCPMLKKDWVQTSEKISNPYAGNSMPTCGVIRK